MFSITIYFNLVILLVSQINLYNSININTEKTILWGPGLKPSKIVMGARYFFLQFVDVHGKNLTESPGEGFVLAEIKGENENLGSCRIWTQIFDCKDGSFIIRYRVFETCYNFFISLKFKGIDNPPALLIDKGPIYTEECYCPSSSLKSWLKEYDCATEYTQIKNDMEQFSQINFDDIRDDIIKEYNKPHSFSICHYIIKNNKIYRKCYGEHVGFKMFSDSILLSLARKVILPDLEFFMNLGDWPLVLKDKPLFPIFSWCGSNNSKDVILPTYDITQSSMESMGRVMLDMVSIQGSIGTPWNKKIEKVFWRGRDARRERLDLIDIARENPDLFNASITNFFFFRDEIEKYGPGEKPVSFFDFFKYKYQLNIDGTVAAYRFPYLLAGDSLVFKQDSEYYEYFYNRAIADVHYIPVERDLSNLVEKIKWAKEHDHEASKIAKAGRALMREVAMPQDVFCYHVSLFQEWNKRIQSPIRVLEGMEEVSRPEHLCECSKNTLTKRKTDRLKDEL